MKFCESDALAVQVIQVGSFNDGIAMGGDVAIALVVREHKYYVGPLRGLR
jgi:hypothetical protein